MANSRRVTPISSEPALDPRRSSKQSVDGIISDPNSGRKQAKESEQSSPPDQRGSSDSGSGEGQSSSIASLGELSGAPSLLPTPDTNNPFVSGEGVLKTIADRFNAAREQNKVGAWRQFQKDLMNASPFLVPHLLPYKDLISIVSDIEKEIKGSNSTVGRSNEELLALFLSGKTTLGADLTSPVPAGIDNSGKLDSGESVAP